VGIPSASTGALYRAMKASKLAALVIKFSMVPDAVLTAARYVSTASGIVASVSALRTTYQSVADSRPAACDLAVEIA
jgi:hypothetical protein